MLHLSIHEVMAPHNAANLGVVMASFHVRWMKDTLICYNSLSTHVGTIKTLATYESLTLLTRHWKKYTHLSLK